jgi:dihydroorotate dehydrogenase (fumarate)
MADLTTAWLGLTLRSPFVVAASPISRDPEAAAVAAQAGAGAIVMHSLFEEQLIEEQMAAFRLIDCHADMNAEASSFMPASRVFANDGAAYLAELTALRRRVDIPVVASLNGTTPGGWTSYAARIADAGANALELNLHDVATLSVESGAEVESRQLEVVAAVVAAVGIPVCVKLTPFHASLPAFVHRLEQAGVRGVTVFNRFHEPVVDLDTLSVRRTLTASTAAELPLRLHALAVLSTTTELSLACTGGVHSGEDAARAILCGAHVVQVASSLMAHGPAHIARLRDQLLRWLDGKGYATSAEARGVLNLEQVPDPTAWTRMNYIRTLEDWRGHPPGRTTS